MSTLPNVDITSPAFKADSAPYWARLRAEAPVLRVTLPGKQTAWLITRYDDVAAALKDERFAKNRANAMTPEQLGKQPWVPGPIKPIMRNMLALDAPDHTRLRALVHKAFTPRLIEQMRDQIQMLCDELLDKAEARGEMDLIRDFALPLPATVIARMLGIPAKDYPKFHRWSNAVATSSPSVTGQLKSIVNLMQFLSYLRRIIRERRADPQDDLISALVQAQENGDQLSEDEMVAMLFLLLVAGHETTVNLIGSGTLALLQDPAAMATLRENPAMIRTAVEELLRFSSPVAQADERYAREDITLHGVTIPRGELVYPVIASANRDETQFAHPDTLDLTRDPNRHLAFGQGVHYCLGAPLARLEGAIAFNTMLRRLPGLALAAPVSQLRYRPGIQLRGLESLPVTFERQRALA